MVINKFNLFWFSLTYQCNNRCVWCYAGSNDYNKMKTLNFDMKYKDSVIDLVSDLKIKRATLIGGEPTVFNGVLDIVASLNKKNIHVGMVSNGRMFSDPDFAFSIKDVGLKSVTVSVEGYDSKSHDSTTKVEGSYNQLIEGIENCNLAPISVHSNTVISKLSYDNLEKIIDSLENKVKSMSFNIAGVCLSKNTNNLYDIHPRDAVKRFESAYLYAKNKGLKIKLVTPMPLCYFDSKLLLELKEQNLIGCSPCQLSHGKNFVIDYNCDIIPCTHLSGYPLFTILQDNKIINSTQFIERYNSLECNEFRNKMSRFASNKCESCKEKCIGGCPLFWYKLNPEKELSDIPAKL